jgi:hypothetical protein
MGMRAVHCYRSANCTLSAAIDVACGPRVMHNQVSIGSPREQLLIPEGSWALRHHTAIDVNSAGIHFRERYFQP